LFQGAMPGQRGVQHLVGEAQPGGAGSEHHIRVWRRRLVGGIQLAAIVQPSMR
jgi:hypothetical protein